jgi:hypothetical protein
MNTLPPPPIPFLVPLPLQQKEANVFSFQTEVLIGVGLGDVYNGNIIGVEQVQTIRPSIAFALQFELFWMRGSIKLKT